MNPAESARAAVLEDHREAVTTVLARADEAASRVEMPAGRATVAGALSDALGDEEKEALVDLLRGAVAAAGRELLAEPVPASPYVVVTARGPLVRATLEDGRLVVLLRCFRRTTDGTYVRADAGPADAPEVRFRSTP